MVKIDKRHKYGIMVDTETANGLDDPLFYDVGWMVIDSHGEIYLERSYVIADVFLGMKDLMETAYYAEKIPQYWEDIKSGKRLLSNTFNIRKQMKTDSELYGCEFIVAHNAFFDYKSLNGTQRYLTKSKYRYFTPYGLEWWDTMRMAQSVICKMPSYRKFCEENNYLTSRGQVRKTAEILYRFIKGDNEFIESHTGLEDVDIERQILKYCYRQHKKMDKKLFKDRVVMA